MVVSLDFSLSPGKKLVPANSSAEANTSAIDENVGVLDFAVLDFGEVGVFCMVFSLRHHNTIGKHG